MKNDIKIVVMPQQLSSFTNVHSVSKNVPPLACYAFDTDEWILIFFDRSVTDKVGNQKTLYMPPEVTCILLHYLAKRGNAKITFSLSWIVLPTQCAYALSSWKKLSSVMCLIASNIFWDSEIFHSNCPLTFTPGLTKNNSHLLHSDWYRDRLGWYRACG